MSVIRGRDVESTGKPAVSCVEDLEVDQNVCERWRDEYRQIARMLQGLATKWRSRSDH